jgi:hypothetical protein
MEKVIPTREDIDRLKARHAARVERRMNHQTLAKEATKRQAKEAHIARIQQAKLFPTALEFKGNRYPLTAATTVRIERGGAATTAQGRAMKTTHDMREIHVIVEGDDYYIDIPAYTGATTAGDAGTMVQNALYRKTNERASEFVGALTLAVKKLGTAQQERAATKERATRTVDELQEVARDLLAEAQQDLAEAQQWGVKFGIFNAVTNLQAALKTEVKQLTKILR